MTRASALALTALTCTLAVAARASERRLVEGIVVRVNDRILTTADMRKRAVERAAENGVPVPAEAYPQLVSEAADDLCLLERAGELKLEVGSDEVSAAVQQLRDQNHVEDQATFEQMLRGMGLTLDQLRARIKDSIMINRVLSRELGNLPITEAELRQRFAREQDDYRIPERVHLEHLVLPVTVEKGDDERKMAAARRLVAAARAGGSFLTLVQDEAKASSGTGGDLGLIAVTDLRPEVREAVASLKPGEISEPFSSAAGVHVVRLVERMPPAVKPFEEVASELRQKELTERYRDRLRGVVDELKKRYVVEVHPELFAPPKAR